MSRVTSPPQHRVRTGLLMVLAILAVTFAFYGIALDNGFWHPEDFQLLAQAQHLAGDSSRLLRHDVMSRFQPIPLALFMMEYRAFGLDPTGWYATNLVIHATNAWLVFWLVTAFGIDRRVAILSGLLFAMGVGSYGKAVLFVAGAENLLTTTLYLLILNLYVRNDLYAGGRILSWRYALVLLLFLGVSLARPTALSLVLGLIAYKVFFRGERGRQRRVFDAQLTIVLVGAIGFWVLRRQTGLVEFAWEAAGRHPVDFSVNFFRNMLDYLVHMFFPMHMTSLIETANPVLQTLYSAAPVIRLLLGWCVISYGLFGFVFGNRPIRFFLAWTLISVLPYCVVQFPSDWLNIRYLYQVSIGFVFVVASGTVYSSDLLHRTRWQRWLPLFAPLLFILMSGYITVRLDTKYEVDAASPESRQRLEQLRAMEPGAMN
jgi:hypothetical protein